MQSETGLPKKKILITGSTFPRYRGDTEPRFLLDFAKAMSEYAEVTVLVPAAIGAADREVLEGVLVERYHYFPIHSLETLCYPGAIVPRIKQKKARVLLVPWLFASLYWNLFKRRKKYDIVHAHWIIPQGIIASFVRIPYLVTGHGGDVTSLNKGIFKYLKKRCITKAIGVTTVSEPLMQVCEQMGDNPNRTVISMGCDTTQFGRQYRKEQYFHQKNNRVILFVGRLAEKKGVTYLIDAMQYIDDAVLVIVGKGPLQEKLLRQARHINKQRGRECIRFLGAKTHQELQTIYASADIFVMPSVTARDGDKEGFGLVMLEAFASGLPVVASKSGGIVDLVQDGVNGYLVEEKNSEQLAERINIVLHDKNIYNKLVEAAGETVRQYDYHEIAHKYYAFIEEILSES